MNRGSLVSEATTLQTEPPPLPIYASYLGPVQVAPVQWWVRILVIAKKALSE